MQPHVLNNLPRQIILYNIIIKLVVTKHNIKVRYFLKNYLNFTSTVVFKMININYVVGIMLNVFISVVFFV